MERGGCETCDLEREGGGALDGLLEAAAAGCPALLYHRGGAAAVIEPTRLRRLLASQPGPRAQLVAEAGGWVALVPGGPTSGSGASPDSALDDLVVALREYAEDWRSHLHRAPNHAGRWPLVQLVALSDDTELRDWLLGPARPVEVGTAAAAGRG